MTELTELQVVEFGLRGGVVVLLLLVAALLLRDHPRSLAARLGAAFACGAAADAVAGTAGFAATPQGWQAPLLALSSGNALVFWLFARALFSDGFALRRWHGVVWAALVAMALLVCFVLKPAHAPSAGAAGLALRLVNLGLLALGLAQAIASWRADLVEGRRRLRLFVVGVAGAYALAIGVLQLTAPAATMTTPTLACVLNAAALAIVALVIVWPLLRIAGGELFGTEAAEPAPELGADAVGDSRPARALAAADRGHVAALERLMNVEQAYREEGLTIGTLAARLALPEYKLRRLINQGLGHRNFNAFLNRYRIDAAQAALANPAQGDVAVLEIAMDAGFQSLGPFNRAFKADTGVTPSEFRRQRSGMPAANGALRLADSEIG